MTREIAWERYLDKVRGGWVGKSLGSSVGHFEGTKRITRFRMRDLCTEGVVANDDLDIQLVWLDVLLDQGVRLDGRDLMAAWIERYDYNFGEYGFARRNYVRGIMPPLSGSYANRYYCSGMGCAIRSEIWGMIAPGDPEVAARYAQTDGSIDHEGDAVHAERFLSAVEAEAFFCDDVPALIDLGLRLVPPGCRLDQCIRVAVDAHRAGLHWEESWKRLRDDYGHPDCTHAPLNLGIIAMALLYGGLHMERAMTIALNSGWDVDCTCSTVGALIGIVQGWKGMDAEWREYIGDSVVTLARPRRSFESLAAVAESTCAAGVALAREGLTCTRILSAPSAALFAVPVARPEEPLVLSVAYHGAPEIAPGAPSRVTLRVENRSAAPVEGTLRVKPPPGLAVDETERAVRVAARATLEVPVTVLAAEKGRALADANVFAWSFTGEGRSTEAFFGLCGAAPGLAMGPFYDSYDDWLDRGSLGPARVLRTATDVVSLPELGEEWGNHRVDVAKPYLAEDFSDPGSVRALFAPGRRVRVREDSFRVADAFGMQGPCCVYVLFEVLGPDAREVQLFLGSTDPYSLWWNGRQLFTQRANRFWFPNNDVVDVAMLRGANQLILKVARTGDDNRLSFVFRRRPVLPGYDSCAFVTDLAWGVPVEPREPRWRRAAPRAILGG